MTEKENNPFLKDTYYCNCSSEATYTCPTCRGNFCVNCATIKPNKQHKYCPTCSGKLYPILDRFIGSTKPLRKWRGDTKGMKAVYVAPKICPKCDRDRINEQKRGEG